MAATSTSGQGEPEQMDAWAGDFNNWRSATAPACISSSRHHFVAAKIAEWAKDEREFVRRAAFSLIACYTVHGKKCPTSLPAFLS